MIDGCLRQKCKLDLPAVSAQSSLGDVALLALLPVIFCGHDTCLFLILFAIRPMFEFRCFDIWRLCVVQTVVSKQKSSSFVSALWFPTAFTSSSWLVCLVCSLLSLYALCWCAKCMPDSSYIRIGSDWILPVWTKTNEFRTFKSRSRSSLSSIQLLKVTL